MKTIPQIITIFTIFIISSCGNKTNFYEAKKFIGYEPMNVIIDPDKPHYKWYHRTTLRFENDSVYIEK